MENQIPGHSPIEHHPLLAQSIGNWHAFIDLAGTKDHIVVDGEFPTNGEKVGFKLETAEVQGINQTELILELTPGNLVHEGGKHTGKAHYKELTKEGPSYKTILVKDIEKNRVIANFKVGQE
ncbi:MAG: hypothetical protein V4543_10860 [Bacteroidota bacterium]